MAICMTDPFWSPAVGGRRGLLAFGDAVGEVGGVVLDEAEQRRAAGVLPRQVEEVQAGHVGDAAPVDHAAVGDHAGDVVQEWSDRKPVAQTTAPTSSRNRTPARSSRRRLVPITNSPRAGTRWPSRDSHQNRSRPASRCGSIGYRVPIERSTWREGGLSWGGSWGAGPGGA